MNKDATRFVVGIVLFVLGAALSPWHPSFILLAVLGVAVWAF